MDKVKNNVDTLSTMDDLTALLEQLQSGVKSDCRRALTDLQKYVNKGVITDKNFDDLFVPLLQIVKNDAVDSFREKSCVILLVLVSKYCKDMGRKEEILQFTAHQIPIEPSEEVRLLLSKILLSALVDWTAESMLRNLDLLTTTIKSVTKDNYGEVVKVGCEIILALSKTNPYFKLQADYFVDPLVLNLNTQSMKVCIMCIKALQPILIHSTLTVPKVVPPLEKIWSKMNPPLQLVTIQTIGNAMVEFDIHEQYFHLMLPVLFLGVCSNFPEIANEATLIWDQLQPKLTTVKAGRSDETLLQAHFSLLIPKLRLDAEDWNNEIRIQSAQLLYQFLMGIGSGNHEIIHVMEILFHQFGDEEARIRNWALKSAYLIGSYCFTDALKWMLKLECSDFHISLYYHLLQGSVRSETNFDHNLSIDLLEKCISLPTDDQLLLDCVDILLVKAANVDCYHMDTIIIAVLSIQIEQADNSTNSKPTVLSLLKRIADLLDYSSETSLIEERLLPLLSRFEAMKQWNTNSVPWRILQSAMKHLQLANESHLDIFYELISSSADAEIKLKSFNILTELMQKLKPNPNQDFVLKLWLLIRSNLQWKSGRTSAVIRSSAALCLEFAFCHHVLDIRSDNVEDYLQVILQLIEDETVSTRKTACTLLQHCCLISQPFPKIQLMDAAFSRLMGRLNDISREVRLLAVVTSHHVLDHWTRLGCIQAKHVQEFTRLLRILIKEEDKSIREAVEGVLKAMEEQEFLKCGNDLPRLNINDSSSIESEIFDDSLVK